MLLLVDLDGVVYRGPEPVPGVPAVLADRVARGDDVVYVTNSSIWHHTDFVARLEGMGAPVSPDRIVSGARATALYLAGRSPRPRLVLVLGAPGLVREMREVGFDIMTAADAAAAWKTNGHDSVAATAGVEAVVVGFDNEVDWARLVVATTAVRAGAHFVAVNRDPIHPTEHGLVPGAGALVSAIATAGAVEPVTIGKPAPMLLEVAAHLVGTPVTEAVMIGDSLTADIPAAIAVGARSILLLTGITTAALAAALPPEHRPTGIAADAAELAAILERMSRH
jgi:HAD superfamily hydrolase (TIGR01450 family)